MQAKAGKSGNGVRVIKASAGKTLKTTPVFDTYWKFAAARQDLFMRRVTGGASPWTTDPILANYRFTNTYRASDRVSQYLLQNVIYEGPQTPVEIFFRVLLFKIFNKIGTWEALKKKVGAPSWKEFDFETYAKILDRTQASGTSIYSAAYIMPSPRFGSHKKHRNHLRLIEHMIKSKAPEKISTAKSLQKVFEILRSYQSLGDFLAFQFSIDLNYSTIINFSEMDFVVAGPGARDGIRKCFSDTAGFTEADIIRFVTDMAEQEFERSGLKFQTLWGRPLQLIDCQNIFCEVDKYSRVAHPEFSGKTGRTRIKQKFSPRSEALPQWYPPKWGIKAS